VTNSIKFRPNPDVVTRLVDGETVIMIPMQGKVLSLNEVGSFIWQRIAEGIGLEQLAEGVCSAFEVSSEQASADTAEFISLLKDKHLITEEN
jgi:hypothetical protein